MAIRGGANLSARLSCGGNTSVLSIVSTPLLRAFVRQRYDIMRGQTFASRVKVVIQILYFFFCPQPENEDKPKFEDLPEECVREILFRLADHRDLLSAAEACGLAQKLSAEQRLWKRLCRFHFSPVQISFVLSEVQKEREKTPLNNSNKNNNRSSRTPHPYFNNNLRRSPVRNGHDTDSSNKSEKEV